MKPLVLIVDDDASVHQRLGTAVERAGLRVAVATNGREGLMMARRERPDVIVLDMDAGVLDGFTFRQHQLADRVLGHVPLIVLSGRHTRAEVQPRMDAHAFFRKPFDLKALVQIVVDVARAAALR